MQTQPIGADPTLWFDALKYGPLGLAGLMLVLVVFALSVSTLEPARERTLRLFLYIGSFCFVVACIFAALPTYTGASHLVYFRVEPLDMGARRVLPPPVITVNGGVLAYPASYAVKADVTAIVDVNDAVGAAEERAATIARQQSVLTTASDSTQTALTALIQANNFASDNQGCPGGAHGIGIPHGPDIVRLNNTAIAALSGAQESMKAYIQK
ncbi:hypothetical protein FKO01_05620 [Mesorhizobium sp. B2-3-3]|uniref:hypothetical protein n=1 Tax=Mesorhizobium sp. B2-3-5 TaxID=2589958 RepID=UPI00112B01C3|nr:hypothetical protein [Mesorhizobium sp. B2-3-5]TPM36517.1 hypothetical protein FJ958_01435 [Mesorhizobium sp. B2-3-5]TPN38794.1 hypothetical protein FKO01_05620 [Mesorhizobium sp. B2-3-3]